MNRPQPVGAAGGPETGDTVAEDRKAGQKRRRDEYLRAQHAARAALMPLDRAQLDDLLDHVDAALTAAGGCDRSLAETDAWAERAGVDRERLHAALQECGGVCDCTVVMNVDADEVFTPVRAPRGRAVPPVTPTPPPPG